MPIVHECQWLGCHKVCPAHQRFCDKHYAMWKQQWHNAYDKDTKRIADRQYNNDRRDQEANTFYHSRQWTHTRDYVKARDYMTSGLSGRVLSDHDYIVDHIIPRRLCRNPLDSDNLWLLSRQEHNKKTKIEETLPDSVLVSMTKRDWISRLNAKY